MSSLTLKQKSNCQNCKEKACCKQFIVPLTYEEHISGKYKIDPSYEKRGWIVLQRKPNGECIYFNSKGLCDIYEYRPEACREYSCVNDDRLNKESG